LTICTYKKECILGEIVNGEFRINNLGECVLESWHDLQIHYSNIQLDEFVIMPNHIHGIIILFDERSVGAGLRPALFRKGSTALSKWAGLRPAPTNKNNKKIHALPEIVRALKSFSSRKVNNILKNTGHPVWQRNYYEHVIRDESDLFNTRQYIINNPLLWEEDDYYLKTSK